jgi:uncharacterized protein involved in outer membrane biogenesis
MPQIADVIARHQKDMSDTLTQPIAQAAPLDAAPIAHRSARRWLKIILLVFILLWLANESISLAIQHTSLNHKITARLASAFGRTVEVGSYSFSLWGRPTLEARSVVVGEDPRFGREYFLRAESLTMSVRWLSLLRGHLDFGTISLTHPSLNLVRNPDGDWNLAAWLPRFSPALLSGTRAVIPTLPPPQPSGSTTSLRFSRINVDGGRINFKRADEKLPFALVGVNGYLEPAGPGQWQMDLEAVPARAAVVIQQAGTLHLSGYVGGTSSRLRPVALALAWTGASISDVLRLVRETDYGVRGNLALALNVRTNAQNWLLGGRAEIRQLHRWDLPLRADNPALNLIANGTLDPEAARFDVADSTLETPRSSAHASGSISWNVPPHVPSNDSAQPAVEFVSDGIDAADLLAWARAFRSGISEDLALRGNARLAFTVGGWPPRISDAALSTAGADLTGKSLPVPVHLNPISLRYDPRGAALQPVTISFGAAGGALHIDSTGAIGALASSRIPLKMVDPKSAPALHIAGNLADAGDLISTARLLGWDISHGWDLKGPLRCDLKWQAAPYPWRAAPIGNLDFGSEGAIAKLSKESDSKSSAVTLRAPFLNLPIEQIRAHIDLKPNARHITLASAEAFGALWSGSFDRREPSPEASPSLSRSQPRDSLPNTSDGWRFALTAEHLAASDLDRWLNPRWRESFLDRVLPFLNSRPLAAAQPENLIADGKISVDQFTLAPVSIHRLQADASIDGRHLTLSNLHAQLARGDLSGSVRADLDPTPAYRVDLDFSAIDLYALTAAAPSLADHFAGLASGKISIAAHGATRADLVSSVQCRGNAQISGAELMTISLTDSFADATFRPGKSAFRDASAAFTCAAAKIVFQHLALSSPTSEIAADGSIDFARNLDFRFTTHPDSTVPRPTRTPDLHSNVFHLTGNLSDPEIAALQSPAPRR